MATVVGLYTNIPMDEGFDALDEIDDKSLSTEFLIRLLQLVLKHIIFEFNKQLNCIISQH